MRLPGNRNQVKEINTPVSSIDYLATICELTGSDRGKTVQDGVSFAPLLKNKKLAERPLFWHYPHYSNQGTMPGSAVRLGNYKLIDNFETGHQELYDLSKDLSETNDLSSSNPEKAKELFELLKKWRKSTGAKPMDPNPNWNGI
jgi:arylsulfatase A-like enzyme